MLPVVKPLTAITILNFQINKQVVRLTTLSPHSSINFNFKKPNMEIEKLGFPSGQRGST